MRKIVKLSLIALSMASIAGVSLAAKPGGYVGAGLGASQIEKPKGSSSSDNRNPAGRLFAGYNFNENFGLEAGLARYGEAKNKFTGRFSQPGSPATYYAYQGQNKVNLTSFDVVGKGYIPIQDSGFNLYGLAGLAYVQTKTDSNSPVAVVDNKVKLRGSSYKQNSTHPIFGVGVAYSVPQSNVTTNLEFTRLQGSTAVFGNKKTSNANMLTLNIAYNFD